MNSDPELRGAAELDDGKLLLVLQIADLEFEPETAPAAARVCRVAGREGAMPDESGGMNPAGNVRLTAALARPGEKGESRCRSIC